MTWTGWLGEQLEAIGLDLDQIGDAARAAGTGAENVVRQVAPQIKSIGEDVAAVAADVGAEVGGEVAAGYRAVRGIAGAGARRAKEAIEPGWTSWYIVAGLAGVVALVLAWAWADKHLDLGDKS